MSNVTQLRQPPHSMDAEQALLGAVLFSADAANEITLAPDAFYRREHRAIWEAVRSVAESRRPVDVVSIADELSATGMLNEAGGIDYLSQLAEATYTASNAAHYAGIVRGKALERSLAAKGHALADIAFGEGSTAEKLADAQALMADLEGSVSETEEPQQINGALREAIANLEYRMDHKGELHGLATGLADLDKHLLGLVDGDMIVVAGRPSMGKTTLACNIAENVALSGGLVIVFSLEMSRRKLMDRTYCSLAKVDAKRYRMGEVTNDEIDRIASVATRLKDRRMYVDDSSMITSAQLLARARRIARKLGQKPALVVVDYLQILRDKGDGHERITRISANLKQTARELNCPVIALSQLNRAVESRGINDRRPVMSDLRESGSIEQDSDVILMLYRDEVYNPESAMCGVAEVIVRKNRDGELGTVHLSAPLHRNRFEDLAAGWRKPVEMPGARKAARSPYAED